MTALPESPIRSETVAQGGAACGYASPLYAASLSEFGEPLRLPASGGWLLRREIPGAGVHDAIGCYPLFSCRDWTQLAADLEALEGALASVTLVADPLGAHSEALLRECFPDLCLRYKEHYIVEPGRLSMETLAAHHRRNVRRGLREVRTEFVARPAAFLDDWARLYDGLIRRHGVSGIAAFSRDAFRRLMDTPGLVMQRAVRDGETVGMVLWLTDGEAAWYHLGAYSERGYELRASYALFWSAFESFRGRIETAALGAAAGARPGAPDGLDRFKAGWATGTRPAFLCGRILCRETYDALTAARGGGAGGWFPAYRAGEFREARGHSGQSMRSSAQPKPVSPNPLPL